MNLGTYPTPTEPGVIRAKLCGHWRDFLKKYYTEHVIVCTFQKVDGEYFTLIAARRLPLDPRRFGPYSGDINWETDVEDGSWWELTLRLSRNNRVYWYKATPIEDVQ